MDQLLNIIQTMLPDLGMMVFFQGIHEYLDWRITQFADGGLERMAGFVSVIAMTMMTLWIMIQGYRIMIGQSREPLMGFIVNAGKNVLILTIAMNGALFNNDLRHEIWDARDYLAELVSGEGGDVYHNIDANLMLSQAIMIVTDKINADVVATKENTSNTFNIARWVSTFGAAGPAMVGGTLCILNEIALALCVTFAPLFIFFLIFDKTRPMFDQWLKFTLGTIFSMGALVITSQLALEVTAIYGGGVLLATWEGMQGAKDVQGNTTALIQSAMQLGGLGVVLSTLIVTAPMIVMNFFAGTLGFTPFSAFSAQGAKAAANGGNGNANAGNEGGDGETDKQKVVEVYQDSQGNFSMTQIPAKSMLPSNDTQSFDTINSHSNNAAASVNSNAVSPNRIPDFINNGTPIFPAVQSTSTIPVSTTGTETVTEKPSVPQISPNKTK